MSLKKSILLIILMLIIGFAGTIGGLKTYFYFKNKDIKPSVADLQAACNYYQRLADLHWAQANYYKSEQTRALPYVTKQNSADFIMWTQKYEMEKSVAQDFENQYQDCKTRINK